MSIHLNKENRTDKKQMIPNEKGLTLTEFFSHLPRARRTTVIISAPKEDFIKELARCCGKTPMTIRRWVYGYVNPCLAEKEKIAEMLNSSVEILFPSKEKAK